MQAFEELKKKIKDIETQSLAMDGCSPSFSVNDIMSIIDSVGKDIDVTTSDTISRQAAISVLMEILDRPKHAEFLYTDEICKALGALPSAQPDEKLRKIADLVEGSIDHFDRDDAIDLLYQIKDVVR